MYLISKHNDLSPKLASRERPFPFIILNNGGQRSYFTIALRKIISIPSRLRCSPPLQDFSSGTHLGTCVRRNQLMPHRQGTFLDPDLDFALLIGSEDVQPGSKITLQHLLAGMPVGVVRSHGNDRRRRLPVTEPVFAAGRFASVMGCFQHIHRSGNRLSAI
ncbi:hypothetical protein D3C81_1425000 [compost metagenome]